MAKNHVKGIIIVGVTQTGKKLTSSTPFEFPKEDKLDGVVLLGFKKKITHSLAQMVFLSQFPLKTGSVQVQTVGNNRFERRVFIADKILGLALNV